jgi:hypothetical protein
MVRWGLKDAFTTPLKRLYVIGNKQKNATGFTYEVMNVTMPTRTWWKNTFDTKWYLAPIPAVEINKGYGMTQNPGW